MTTKRTHLKLSKLRHSSLELSDPEQKSRKSNNDVLSKARSKFFNFSDVLKHRRYEDNNNDKGLQKSMTNCTLDYLIKHSENKPTLKKQTSVGSYPQIQISSFDDHENDEVFYPINRLRPATVCVDRPSVDRRSDAEALALERPRKKLSFKEPEVEPKKNGVEKAKLNLQNTLKILKYGTKPGDCDKTFSLGKGIQSIAGLGLTVVTNGVQKSSSYEDKELESQAMRVVRTVGQAFEVCHKLSVEAPEDNNYDDEQDTTLTQDLLSDRLSDVASDKPKKDLILETSDKNSLPPDEGSVKDGYLDNSIKGGGRTMPAHLDILQPPAGSGISQRKQPPSQYSSETYGVPNSTDGINHSSLSSTLSAQHEIQLLREQLEQQRQQTQAAMAQLQLVREQMQAEQTARMEAQTRTHQLLVHNRELLDHIAALVGHLQGGDGKLEQQSSPPHMAMPQQDSAIDTNLVLQALGLQPPQTAACQSPLRNTFNPNGGGMFNFNPVEPIENQLMQRMQPFNYYPQYYHPQSPFMYNPYMQTTPFNYATLPRSYNIDKMQPSRHSEPRQIPSLYSMKEEKERPHDQHQKYSLPSFTSQLSVPNLPRRHSSNDLPEDGGQQCNKETQFIKPLSQVGTLTTTDSEGRVRVIVPVPSNGEERDGLSNLRISDELRLMNGPGISRSASERVPNRTSEMLSQVQRTMWARHTTK